MPQAFQRALAAPDDASVSRLFAEAVPVYFADFWARRAEFAPFVSGIRFFREPATASDPVPFDTRETLGTLTMPTVIITGRHDFLCGPRLGEFLAEHIPHARMTFLEHSGHFGHVEEPAAFGNAAARILHP